MHVLITILINRTVVKTMSLHCCWIHQTSKIASPGHVYPWSPPISQCRLSCLSSETSDDTVQRCCLELSEQDESGTQKKYSHDKRVQRELECFLFVYNQYLVLFRSEIKWKGSTAVQFYRNTGMTRNFGTTCQRQNTTAWRRNSLIQIASNLILV